MGTYYPPPAFHFRVEFDLEGVSDRDFRFRDVAGLSVEVDEESHNEGGENRFVHRLPGRARHADLVLKRGLLTDSVVRRWCEDAIQALDIRPTTVWVSVLDEEHEPLKTFTFVNAWPKKWSVSDLNAESSAILVESLEFAFQYFKVD